MWSGLVWTGVDEYMFVWYSLVPSVPVQTSLVHSGLVETGLDQSDAHDIHIAHTRQTHDQHITGT